MAAVSWFLSRRSDAGCEHDPRVSGAAHRCRSARLAVCRFRSPVEGALLPADGRTDRRCHAGGCAQSEEHRGRDGGGVKERQERPAGVWRDEPAKARQKDTDARWTLKLAKARPDIVIPSLRYKSTVSICCRFGFIRKGKVTGWRTPRRSHSPRRGDRISPQIQRPSACKMAENEPLTRLPRRIKRSPRLITLKSTRG